MRRHAVALVTDFVLAREQPHLMYQRLEVHTSRKCLWEVWTSLSH